MLTGKMKKRIEKKERKQGNGDKIEKILKSIKIK